jgi:exodeoxyribonuclease VII small subunit
MEKTFEQNITELEAVVKKLESGDCSLNESVELYAKGLELSAACKKQLDGAKQKIENLSDYVKGDYVNV